MSKIFNLWLRGTTLVYGVYKNVGESGRTGLSVRRSIEEVLFEWCKFKIEIVFELLTGWIVALQ